jgi:SAM-dependent methyltransferase
MGRCCQRFVNPIDGPVADWHDRGVAVDPAPAWAVAHYSRGLEESRLSAGPGLLEQERTRELLGRYLPPPPAKVADIGAGPGAYSLWLADRGYEVVARDLMPLHVDQLRSAAVRQGQAIDAEVGDARRLELPDQAFDAVLLFGPLYHLQDRESRLQVLKEAARIVVPRGLVLAVAISRWAVLLDGRIRLRLGEGDPGFDAVLDEVERSGHLDPLQTGGFSGFLHRPAELSAEVADAGLHEVALLSIEGPGAYLADADLEQRWADPAARSLVLDVARRLEVVPELAGFGSHLMVVARRKD